jgi:hypothetical protein
MTLIPFDKREGMPLNVVAKRAGKSPGTSVIGASSTALGGAWVEANGS